MSLRLSFSSWSFRPMVSSVLNFMHAWQKNNPKTAQSMHTYEHTKRANTAHAVLLTTAACGQPQQAFTKLHTLNCSWT
jgi:hypothetical protein